MGKHAKTSKTSKTKVTSSIKKPAPRKRRPKGEFVCDWCWAKFPTQEKMGFTCLGNIHLCNPCGNLHVDMVIYKNDADRREDIQTRMKACPGLQKQIKELNKRQPRVSPFSLTIIKFKP